MTHARRVMDKHEIETVSKLYDEFKAAIDGTEGKVLPEDEAAKAYKKFLIRKGRDPKKAGAMKKSGGASKPSKPRPKPSVKKEAKSPAVKKVGGIKRKAALDDDDSDSDIPLAALKSNNGGSGFKIPKKE